MLYCGLAAAAAAPLGGGEGQVLRIRMMGMAVARWLESAGSACSYAHLGAVGVAYPCQIHVGKGYATASSGLAMLVALAAVRIALGVAVS